ncbi:hypothetical protein PoB_004702400 [Plakobranchus ocellatus]|uniref:Uncharacterized protein n=1 Tax=Plakobranchus ocellatus TaxID=259542 RepID=A0AAV4BQC7_9GAST|nr:hypothetical protein PoB_004702400 [Plakobranchus ocellatus]
MKLLLDLTTTTWLEHGKNHAAVDKDYDTDQFDSDEGDNYEDDDDKDDDDDDDDFNDDEDHDDNDNNDDDVDFNDNVDVIVASAADGYFRQSCFCS